MSLFAEAAGNTERRSIEKKIKIYPRGIIVSKIEWLKI